MAQCYLRIGAEMMGLLGFIKNKEEQTAYNLDLAEGLLSKLFLSIDNYSEDKKGHIEAILKQCPTGQDVLNKVIELCGEPTTPRQRCLVAKAYAWSKVEYRKLAIKYLELYLNNPIYADAYKNSHHLLGDKLFSLTEEKNIHLAEMYSYLGKAYAGEYDFDRALDCFQKEQILAPSLPSSYCSICSIMAEQNKLSEAMEVYLAATKSIYYQPFEFKIYSESFTEDTFKTVIDAHFIALQEKIDKRFV